MPYIVRPEQYYNSTYYAASGSRKIRGGAISIANNDNRTFDTPYQMAYEGMLVQFASTGALTILDGDAHSVTMIPDTLIAKPCTDGARPDGWVRVGTLQTTVISPLSGGAAAVYLPLTAELDSRTTPAYAKDYTKWTTVAVAALQPGDVVGMPVSAATNVDVGAEISCADDNGNVGNATSGDVVIGVALEEADNTEGADAAINCKVRIVTPYVKA